jgi:hypothetical protein
MSQAHHGRSVRHTNHVSLPCVCGLTMYFPRQSAPLRLKKDTGRGPRAAAPSRARTAAVFPVPGGPWSSTPRDGDTPSAANASGYTDGEGQVTFRSPRHMMTEGSNLVSKSREAGRKPGASLNTRKRLCLT